MQQGRQTTESEQVAIFSPDTIAEIVQIPRTDMSTVKTMTVLQSTGIGVIGFETTNRSLEGLTQ